MTNTMTKEQIYQEILDYREQIKQRYKQIKNDEDFVEETYFKIDELTDKLQKLI